MVILPPQRANVNPRDGEHPAPGDLQRMAKLMDKDADRPMDFADASLVAVSERLRLQQVVTVARTDFSVCRLPARKPFVIVGP